MISKEEQPLSVSDIARVRHEERTPPPDGDRPRQQAGRAPLTKRPPRCSRTRMPPVIVAGGVRSRPGSSTSRGRLSKKPTRLSPR